MKQKISFRIFQESDGTWSYSIEMGNSVIEKRTGFSDKRSASIAGYLRKQELVTSDIKIGGVKK